MHQHKIKPTITDDGNITKFEYDISAGNNNKLIDINTLQINLPDSIPDEQMMTLTFGNYTCNYTTGELRKLSKINMDKEREKNKNNLRNKIKYKKYLRTK